MTEFPRRCALLSKLTALAVLAAAPEAHAFSVDGDGHYGLRGSTQTAPGFSKETGYFQAIEQSFSLLGEARFNDLSSMYLEFRLFDDPRESYLGDTGRPRDCKAGNEPASDEECDGKHQSSGEPGYEPYTPKITKAYIRYAFDYCIVEAGRRGRDWGLGIFLDSGSDPFETDASVFDGISCDINIQKASTLGFKIGYDKLAETGTYVIQPPANSENEPRTRRFGANDTSDDLDQFFFAIEYDDRKANAGEAFTKQIGVYFAQVNGRDYKQFENDGSPKVTEETGGSATDLKFLDLYTGFFLADLALRNEILFRMGKSADPNWQGLGGDSLEEGQPTKNKLDAIAVAGSIDWTLSRSGAAIGPAEYNRGDASRHVLFLNYAYAPGDEDGYLDDRIPGDPNTNDARAAIAADKRNGKVDAVAFHRNYKPALILFNSRPEADKFIVDGAFNPSRVVNASVLGTGYRYESLENGNFEVRLLTAQLIAGVPGSVKDYYDSIEGTEADSSGNRPAGFYGKDLGYELDLSYSYKVGREAELGVAGAAALPGDAWKTHVDRSPTNNMLLQTYAAFKF